MVKIFVITCTLCGDIEQSQPPPSAPKGWLVNDSGQPFCPHCVEIAQAETHEARLAALLDGGWVEAQGLFGEPAWRRGDKIVKFVEDKDESV